jgi:hypothetical protein
MNAAYLPKYSLLLHAHKAQQMCEVCFPVFSALQFASQFFQL